MTRLLASNKWQQTRKSHAIRGRPQLPSPTGFEDAFGDKVYKSGTLRNKKTHIRMFSRFLVKCKKGKKLCDADVNDAYEYGLMLIDHEITKQVLINYITTCVQYLQWHGQMGLQDTMLRWPLMEAALYRGAKNDEAIQAPVITRNQLNAMDIQMRRICCTMLATGVRFGTLQSLSNDDYVNLNPPVLQMKDFKFVPDDFTRSVPIMCNCTQVNGQTTEESKKLCVIHSLGLLDFTNLKKYDVRTALQQQQLQTHSCKRTLAVYIRLFATTYKVRLEMSRVYRLLGWQMPKPTKAGTAPNFTIFKRYTKDYLTFDFQKLPDLSGIARAVLMDF